MLAATLGRHWSYVTPQYMYWQMDDVELNRYLAQLPYEDLCRVFGRKPRRADTRSVADLERAGVVKRG